jgi:phosphoribosylpyrophosphate synthetase
MIVSGRVSGAWNMAEDPQTAWTNVYCLREYNPYRLLGELNPAFRKETDGRLLDLKDNSDRGVFAAAADFRLGLDSLNLPNGTVITIVPGHEALASNEGRPLARAAQALANEDKRYLAKIDTLIRTKTVSKKTGGGSRDISIDLNSITVNAANVAGATVVVLDDTATTGGSLMAARQLLQAAGATKIAAVAIGRTVKYF